MSWVRPEFACGQCGGMIARWPTANGLAWRHRTVPAGAAPHKAALAWRREDIGEAEEAPVIPPPEVPARPALADDLPGGATAIVNVAEKNAWTVQAWFMRGPWIDSRGRVTRTASSVVLWIDRDGHRIVASWSTDLQDVWKFEAAWSLTHQQREIGSTEMRALLTAPRAVCEDCKEPPALHYTSPTGPVCWAEYRGGTT